jgi:hypothetical protein
VIFVSAWLKGKREVDYRREYLLLPLPLRAAYGLATVGLIVAGFVAFIVPR